jgi:hypothetical protein
MVRRADARGSPGSNTSEKHVVGWAIHYRAYKFAAFSSKPIFSQVADCRELALNLGAIDL